ncbi:MAG: response regulator transcription factor [Firmicutes bacterium]|nr:response regulator transcription factor [Bacillota bacterium]
MVNIIIVEDNRNYRMRTKTIIESYMMETNINYTIKTFESYTDKLKKIIEHSDDGHYIYILDIDLQNDDSGIDIANDIRSKCDYDSIIILETGYKELLSEAQRLRLSILDYVCKSVNYDKNIKELLDLSLEIFGYKKSLKFQMEKIDYNLKYDDIYRIETDTLERKCVVITKNKKYDLKKPLYFFEKQLNKDFYKINKGCIVNVTKIKKVDYNRNVITFDNGDVLRGNISIRSVKGLRIILKAKE